MSLGDGDEQLVQPKPYTDSNVKAAASMLSNTYVLISICECFCARLDLVNNEVVRLVMPRACASTLSWTYTRAATPDARNPATDRYYEQASTNALACWEVDRENEVFMRASQIMRASDEASVS